MANVTQVGVRVDVFLQYLLEMVAVSIWCYKRNFLFELLYLKYNFSRPDKQKQFQE